MRPRPARLVLAGCVTATLSLGTALAGVPASAGPDDPPSTSSSARVQGGEPSRKPVKKPKSLVQFLSKDGSAETGTTTTFTLTPTTGAALRIPVTGQGPNTVSSQVVKPGKYTVTSEPSVLNGATYTVSKIAPANGVVTVKKPKKGAKKNAVTKVTFSLAKDAPDTLLTLGGATPTSVSLSWTGPEGASYVLRRTEGYSPAASAEDGTGVALASATGTSVVDEGVAGATTYTYTLFGTVGASALEPSSLSLATPSADGGQPTVAIAPDTVVPATLAELQAEPLSESTVAVTLPSGTARASRTAVLPSSGGRWSARATGGQCVVGAPFLLSTDAAGEDAFYGVIESCDGSSGAMRRREGGERAVVNTDVALNSVLSYLDIDFDRNECTTDEATSADTTCASSDDTDGDGLPDENEADAGSDPRKPDTDGDGLTDGEEVQLYGSSPLREDTDRDDYPDPDEVEEGTDPGILDTDGDGLLDAEEVYYSETDPLSPDTDGDGATDTREVEEGSNPDNPKSLPTKPRTDTDGDKLTDPREELNESDPTLVDTDGDGLDDYTEVTVWASYPDLADSDDDGVDDGDEVAAGTQPMEDESTVIAPIGQRTVRSSARGPLAGFCNSSSRVNMDLRAGYVDERKFKVTMSGTRFSYDIAFVGGLYANPLIDAAGAARCDFSLESGAFPLAVSPVPITLNLSGSVNANTSGSFYLSGPDMKAQVGFRGNGYVEVANVCKFLFFCYPELRQSVNFSPANEFRFVPPTVDIRGRAGISAKVALNVSVGYDNRFGKAKAGFTGTVVPFDASFDAVATNKTRCARFTSSGRADVTLRAEAWALNPKFGLDYQRQLFSSTFGQKSGNVGRC
jgi:hypothetical protein